MKTAIGECTIDHLKIAFLDFDPNNMWEKFDNIKKTYVERIEPSFFVKNNYRAILIRYDYKDKNIIETLYFATLLARFAKVFLVTEMVSEMEVAFFQKKKIAGIISLNEIRNHHFQFISNRSTNHFVNTEIISDKQYSKNQTHELFKLSTTEIEVLFLISRGFTNGEISDKIHKSYHTIKNHKSNIASKTGIESCRHLLSFALNPSRN